MDFTGSLRRSLPAGAIIGLLLAALAGGGTYALWRESVTLGPWTVRTGTLHLEAVKDTPFTCEDADHQLIDSPDAELLPGGVITCTGAVHTALEGRNLHAQLTTDASALPDYLTVTATAVDAAVAIDREGPKPAPAPLPYPVEDDHTYTVTVAITWDKKAALTCDSKEGSGKPVEVCDQTPTETTIPLGAVAILLEQTRPSA
ncbi:MAG: alternate-type signal peptide domain-containing protein [Cellulomonadaceae bacterium]|jgi:alternate signal-mediated exported protein|nr:alternate-type signal peptide domain-containing protein [Cellulomonadaceae bacterium]